MSRLARQTAVIARRDFVATVATPTFLLFLLAPMFMILFGLVGGLGASHMASGASGRAQIAAIADDATAERLRAADRALRATYHPQMRPADLRIEASQADPAAQARALLAERDKDIYAVLYGPLERPTILREATSERSAPYLAFLAEQVLRADRAGLAPDAALSRPDIQSVSRAAPSRTGRQSTGFAAIFVVFFLTLLLAGQAVGMLAEEKGNKVIEILAAAVPLEAVFLGKLIGMFGVALLFIAFWGAMGLAGFRLVPEGAMALAGATPAIGWPLFLVFGAAYFTMAYMLLGAVFLGVGSQASTVREIQMLSLPITIFQFGMFGLAAVANGPGSPLALFAQIFPFSSPYAMAAHGATDPRIWPHLLALGWQLVWVALTITAAARFFRMGVLKSGPGGFRWLRRPAVTPDSLTPM